LNIRIAAVGALAAALLAGGATAANAAVPAQHFSTNRAVAAKHAPAPSISIAASTTRVRAGKSVTFTGSTSGLQNGSTLTLQEQVRGRWVSLSASTTVKRSNSYRITGTLSSKGKQTLRVVDGRTASPSVTVAVY
jgi:type IV pilus biogenesis protein CpaD/CtpE